MSLRTVTQLYDRLWAVLEAGAETPPLVRTKNRIKWGTATGWLKDRMFAPADFPKIGIWVGERFTHSGLTAAPNFATEDPGFVGGTAVDFDIERTETVTITLTSDVPVLTGLDPLREAVIDDLMRSGGDFGLAGAGFRVLGWGPITGGVRRTRGGDEPLEGVVSTVAFPVNFIEYGRVSLA